MGDGDVAWEELMLGWGAVSPSLTSYAAYQPPAFRLTPSSLSSMVPSPHSHCSEDNVQGPDLGI